MTAFADVDDIAWLPLEPFEVDGIHYDPAAKAMDADNWYRPPLLELRTDGECHCDEAFADFGDTCSMDAFRWLPGKPNMPALRFGGAA